ncbi:MAG: glycosyltransferase family 4 protein, partial [Fibrobacteres bacterium]|nr:glycosyltransferase family 4 protein [Fibrobacterota bacterium]
METQKPEFGFNVIGYITANLGQGVAARNTVRRLVNCGYKVSCVDLDPGYGRSNQDKTFEHLIAPDNAPAPYSINIFHMNPPEYRIFMRHFPHMFRFRDRINVCVPFWELNRIPQSWVQPLELMDVVLAPTEFIKHAVASSVSDVSIRKLTSAAYLPEFEKTTRDKYGINNDSVAFVTSFDVTSEAARKNPWAAIQAFNESFSQKDNVNLIIKINGQNYDGFEKVRDQLNELKTRNKKIILIDAKMSYPEVISLYACCDVFVSLHRGEGLGLGLMEAMLLGKPVIGTAYSGNMDFMDDSNSCLVNYKLIQIPEKNVNHYSKEALGTTLFWADPDLNEASAWMKRLAKSRILREEIGQKAKSTQIQRQNDNSVFNTLIEISNNHKERLSESRKRYCLKSG